MLVLVFEIDDRRFGVAQAYVRRVVRAVAVTPLPNAPAVVEGVINVHGTITPVYDPRARFGLERRPVRASDQMILAWVSGRLVALRVDRVDWLVDVPDERVRPQPELVTRAEYVAGVAVVDDELVVIHDLGAFLSAAEAATLDAAMAATEKSSGARA